MNPASTLLVIRKATPADAAALVEHVNRIAEEAGHAITLAPGEFDMTVKQEEELLAEIARSDNGVFLVAEIDGAIVGVLNCRGGKRRAVRHAAVLGISVRKAWCGKGIGSALMAAAIQWARETGVIRRIELLVFADNTVAINLYRKFGFVQEGHKRQSVLRDGKYIDDLIMAKLLDDAPPARAGCP